MLAHLLALELVVVGVVRGEPNAETAGVSWVG